MITDPDAALLHISQIDKFRVVDAFSGVHIFGGIGSGKTSGSGRMLAGAYLRAGWGGLVTAVKAEEVTLWKRYAAEHGREQSLIIFDENEGFNFLAYELARQGAEGIGTVVECLMRVMEAAKKTSITSSQRGGEAFWEDSVRKLLRYSIPPLFAATGQLDLAELIRFINTAPKSPQDPRSPEWQQRSFMYQVMDAAARRPRFALAPQTLHNMISYWAEEFPYIPDKTQGNMVVSLTTVLDRFLHGRLNRVFCGRTTLVPELTFHGAVIVLAMPTTVWNEDGIIAQQLFKFLWQRAVLSRNNLAAKHAARPVFLWSDEAQETVSSYDGEFLSICRASKCAVTYLTQSLPTYYAKMGGDNPRDTAHTLVGKFMTNIFHSNGCPDTNEYASRIIGKVPTRQRNYSAGRSENVNFGMNTGESRGSSRSSSSGGSFSSTTSNQGRSSTSGGNWSSGTSTNEGHSWGYSEGRGYGSNTSRGYQESMQPAIEPGDFARTLKTGGKANAYEVTGIWFQAGRIFQSTGTNMMLGRFRQ